MKIIIMRGIPGSGKNHWIDTNLATSRKVVLSTDDYHVDPDGVWRFKQSQLAEFHNRTLCEYTKWVYLASLKEVTIPHHIVVNNTNIRLFELAPYYRLAEAFGAEVEIVWCFCSAETAYKRGTHGVPEQKVREMANSFEAIPLWWKQTIVNTEKE